MYGYRASVAVECGAAFVLGILGFFRFINLFLAIIGVAVVLPAFFVSLRSEFAKEARKIVRFHKDGNPWHRYPATEDERVRLWYELYPELSSAGEKTIRSRNELERQKELSQKQETPSVKAARVKHDNARGIFSERWDLYASIDIMPMNDTGEPWMTPEVFLAHLGRRMQQQESYKRFA